ncbi:MAG: DNA polymerase III subunit alpha, partial [Oscillospiraceae bacterium]|nr:DNA polymerase III subunit alpha [Oscillospiraceae bacterium]
PRNTSTHAAGVVITKRPVYDYVPLSTNDGLIVTQYTMTTLERLGLLKMDFLGLRNLTVIDDAEKEIRRTEPDFSMTKIRDDDPETFAMLSRGRTAGVFQLESAGITAVCTQMKPQSIEDMTAIVALYRPGPMDSIPRFIQSKMHPETITYKHPLLEPILSVTYGCIVYQEQVIEIFRKLGGFSLGQADNMRRAISKKKQDVIKSERQAFIYGDETRGICGALRNGVPEDVAQSIYNEILDFANYAFNKAHAVSYAKVSYDTAYLKCHYPREYMAALMTSVLDSTDKISFYRNECKELGIPVLPPDVNESEYFFTVVPKGIRFGLAAVKNIGRGFVQTLSQERQENGPFASLEEFCRRMNGQDLNKRAMENLIKCGACDCFGLRRSQMLRIYESVMDAESSFAKRNGAGQLSLFDDGTEELGAAAVSVPDIPELAPRERMHMEKEATGMFFSGHPLEGKEQLLRRLHVAPIHAILESMAQGDGRFRDEQNVIVAGVVQSVKLKSTRNNSMMAYVSIEDDGGTMETLVFSSVLGKSGSLLREDAMVLLEGRISAREEKEPQLVVNEVRELSQDLLAQAEEAGSVKPTAKRLYLRLPSENSRAYPVVKAVLELFPGETQIVLFFRDTRVRRAAHASIAEPMLAEMRELLGEENVVLTDC